MIVVVVTDLPLISKVRGSRMTIRLAIYDRLLAIESLAVKPKAATHITLG